MVMATAAAAVLLWLLEALAVVAGVGVEAAGQAADLPARAVAVQQHQLQQQQQQQQQHRLLSVLVLLGALRSRCAGCFLTALRQLKGRPGDCLLVLLLLSTVMMMHLLQQQRKRKLTTSTRSKLLGWRSQQQLTQGHAGLSHHLDSGVCFAVVDA
jgi:hypothetical protein